MTEQRPRWRSPGVNLVLLGTAGSLMTLLAGCSGSGGGTSWSSNNHRNVYATAADCAADYSAAVCAAKGESLGNRFLGPTYRVSSGRPKACHSSDPGPGKALSSPRIDIERGGFGPSCSSSRRRSGSRMSSWGG